MFKKITVIAISLLLFSFSAAAQDAMPTKEETVNYLNKKLQEVMGRSPNEDRRQIFNSAHFKFIQNKVEIRVQQAIVSPAVRVAVFDPAHIGKVSVDKGTYGNPDVGWIQIGFASKLVEHKFPDLNGQDSFYDYARFPFLRSVPGNAEKIVKAIHHLRDLAKAEDELF
jgi:hypothetical protein